MALMATTVELISYMTMTSKIVATMTTNMRIILLANTEAHPNMAPMLPLLLTIILRTALLTSMTHPTMADRISFPMTNPLHPTTPLLPKKWYYHTPLHDLSDPSPAVSVPSSHSPPFLTHQYWPQSLSHDQSVPSPTTSVPLPHSSPFFPYWARLQCQLNFLRFEKSQSHPLLTCSSPRRTFFYKRSHLSALENCALLFSTNFSLFSYLKNA